MNKVHAILSSMKTMVALMLMFAITVGYATFVENDYGTMTAKADIYNARWFEILLGFLALNLFLNIIKFKMARKEKILVFTFHSAFLIILIGAAVTRYFGYEGVMHIREGESNNVIVSNEPYVTFNVHNEGKSYMFQEPLFLSKHLSNTFERTLEFEGKEVKVKLEGYMGDASF